MNKEEFLAMFKSCIEDNSITIGLEEEWDCDGYVNVYPVVNMYNQATEENYSSKEKFKYAGISIKK